MSGKLKLSQVQLGTSADTTKNFVLATPTLEDGTLSLARASGTPILTVSADGVVRTPQTPAIGFMGTLGSSGIAASGILGWSIVRNDGGYFNGTRFTPLVAGYYVLTCNGQFTIASMQFAGLSIQVNGAVVGTQYQGPYTGSNALVSVAHIAYLNGSTDYVEFSYAASPTGGTMDASRCSGSLIQRMS